MSCTGSSVTGGSPQDSLGVHHSFTHTHMHTHISFIHTSFNVFLSMIARGTLQGSMTELCANVFCTYRQRNLDPLHRSGFHQHLAAAQQVQPAEEKTSITREDFTMKRHPFSSSLMAPNKIPPEDGKQIEKG